MTYSSGTTDSGSAPFRTASARSAPQGCGNMRPCALFVYLSHAPSRAARPVLQRHADLTESLADLVRQCEVLGLSGLGAHQNESLNQLIELAGVRVHPDEGEEPLTFMQAQFSYYFERVCHHLDT